MPTPIKPAFRYRVDHEKLAHLKAMKKKMGAAFPKVGVLVVAYNASDLLVSTLKRIPPEALDIIDQIFLFDDFSTDNTFELAQELSRTDAWAKKLRPYRNIRNVGYGGNQKIGFSYAIESGMDYVVLLHGDGQYAPEYLPDLIYEAVVKKHAVVFGSRMMERGNAIRGGMPLYKWVGNKVLTFFENMILGLNLTEFHSGYRLYATDVLKRIPYLANVDGFSFDTEIIIQCRALNEIPHEIAIPTFYGDEICRVNGVAYAAQVCWAVLRYRLHQVRLIHEPGFNVDRGGGKYKLKGSRFSSHGTIVSLVQPGGLVLDVGCGMGLLAERLTDKGVRVVGIDSEPKEAVWKGLAKYHRADIEHIEQLKTERNFDTVVLADVIEHVRNPQTLLRNVRSRVRPTGKIVASTGNIAIWYYRLSLLLGRFNYGERGILDETHVHLYTVQSFKRLIEQNGYRIQNVRYTNLPFELIFQSIGKSLAIKALDYVYAALVRLWPAFFAYQIIIEAEIAGLEASRGEGLIVGAKAPPRKKAA